MRESTASELYVALIVASFFGKTDCISLLIQAGVDVNGEGKPEDFGGFHSHASALHQAVSSGSMEAVKLLVEAGASLHARDKVYQGTPLGWAMYFQAEEAQTDQEKKKFAEIEAFLKSQDVPI
jgi:ankyrin repeat protein